MHVDVADDPLLVNDDDGTLANPLILSVHAVFLGDLSFGMEIGEQRVGVDPANGLGKSNVTGNAVNRNAHDLGVIPFKVSHLGLKYRHLHGSASGPVKAVKSENDVLLSATVA